MHVGTTPVRTMCVHALALRLCAHLEDQPAAGHEHQHWALAHPTANEAARASHLARKLEITEAIRGERHLKVMARARARVRVRLRVGVRVKVKGGVEGAGERHLFDLVERRHVAIDDWEAAIGEDGRMKAHALDLSLLHYHSRHWGGANALANAPHCLPDLHVPGLLESRAAHRSHRQVVLRRQGQRARARGERDEGGRGFRLRN